MIKTERLKQLFGGISYGLMTLLVAFYLKLEWTTSYQMNVSERFCYLLLICVLLYIGTWFCTLKKERLQKRMHITFQIMFVIYILLFFTLTLLDPQMGRSVSVESRSWIQVKEYFEATANLELFRMIKIYWFGLQHGMISLSEFCMNIAGNFIVAMPFAFFLPMFSKKMRKWIPFTVSIICFVLFIECLQVVTMSGYFDVDDILLNGSGALVMFWLMKQPRMKALVHQLTLGAFDYEDKRA